MLSIIQSLWVGDKLSPLEQMCIKSYLRVGHVFRLYTYGKVEGVPTGTTVKSAATVAPEWKISKFQNLANFSDYFRFMLLYRDGGWWSDLDVFCLRPYDFSTEYVFASQLSSNPGHPENVTTCAMKVPRYSDAMRFCLEEIAATDTMKNDWADIGPILLARSVFNFKLERFVYPKWAFCPLDHYEAPNNIFGPDSAMTCVGDAYAIHLWNEEARRGGIDKFGPQLGSSLFNSLKMKTEE